MTAAVNSRAAVVLLVAWWACGCDGEALSGDKKGPAAMPDAGEVVPAGPGKWEALPSMPGTARFYVGVAAVGSRIFVVGGLVAGGLGGPESREVTAYDTATGTWEILAPLPASFP